MPEVNATTAAIGSDIRTWVVFAKSWSSRIGVLPVVDPIMLKLNALVFAISHMMWGATVGLVLGWRATAALTPQTAA